MVYANDIEYVLWSVREAMADGAVVVAVHPNGVSTQWDGKGRVTRHAAGGRRYSAATRGSAQDGFRTAPSRRGW